MAKPKRRKQAKRKGKIKVSSKARVVRKDSVKNNGLAPTKTVSTDNGVTFKVKIKKKAK